MLTEIREKETTDKFSLGLDYSGVFRGAERISSATVHVYDANGTDQSASMLDNIANAADTISGTATAGGPTSITDSAKDFAALGVEVGQYVLNTTKGWRAKIRAITKTTNAFDTLVFDAPASAAAAGDAYYLFLALAKIKAGTDGSDYLISFDVTSSSGRVFNDSIPLQVRNSAIPA